MTLAKLKHRYIGVYISDNFLSTKHNFLDVLSNRYLEIFGSIDFNNSYMRIIKINNVCKNVIVLKCRLETLTNTLLTLQFINLNLLIISVSGTIKQLKKKIYEFLKCIFNNSDGVFNEFTYS